MKKKEFLKIIEINKDLINPGILKLINEKKEALDEEMMSYIADQISATSHELILLDQADRKLAPIYQEATQDIKNLNQKAVHIHQKEVTEWGHNQSKIESEQADEILSTL